jgi:hypothetical protein
MSSDEGPKQHGRSDVPMIVPGSIIIAACIVALGILASGGFYSMQTAQDRDMSLIFIRTNKLTGEVCRAYTDPGGWDCRTHSVQ